MKKFLLILFLLAAVGCEEGLDTQRATYRTVTYADGTPAEYSESLLVELYSGGVLAKQWRTIGHVTVMNLSSYQFIDASTGNQVRVPSTVVIQRIEINKKVTPLTKEGLIFDTNRFKRS